MKRKTHTHTHIHSHDEDIETLWEFNLPLNFLDEMRKFHGKTQRKSQKR